MFLITFELHLHPGRFTARTRSIIKVTLAVPKHDLFSRNLVTPISLIVQIHERIKVVTGLGQTYVNKSVVPLLLHIAAL